MAKRRANGEGSIYPAADGRYATRIRLDGRLHATHARTQREAAAWPASLRSRAAVDVTDRSTLAEVQRLLATARGEPLEGLFYLAVVIGGLRRVAVRAAVPKLTDIRQVPVT